MRAFITVAVSLSLLLASNLAQAHDLDGASGVIETTQKTGGGAFIGLGLAGLITGGTLVAIGAPRRRADVNRDDGFLDLNLDGVGFIVLGSFFAAGGLAMIMVGTTRVSSAREAEAEEELQSAFEMRPQAWIAPTSGGAGFTLTF